MLQVTGHPKTVRVAARREKKCSAWLVQRYSLRSADPSRRNERQEQSVEGKIFILRILALRAHVFKSRCSRSPCCWWYLLVLMRFLSSCTVQLAGTLSEPKDTTSNPLNRDSSILLWEVENVVAYRGLNRPCHNTGKHTLTPAVVVVSIHLSREHYGPIPRPD